MRTAGAFHGPNFARPGAATRARSMHASWIRSRPTVQATGSPLLKPSPHTAHIGVLRRISPSVVIGPRGRRAMQRLGRKIDAAIRACSRLETGGTDVLAVVVPIEAR